MGRFQGSRSPSGWRMARRVVGAGGAELSEGDGVAAGLGQEVAAVAEHVRPLPGPGGGRGLGAAELPGTGDHLLVVAGAVDAVQVGQGAQGPGGDAGGVQGVGGVLGDVVGHGLDRELAAGAGQGQVVADGPRVCLGAEAQPDRRLAVPGWR